MRVHITGNAGSGKSTLAKEIGQILGLTVYGLDMIVWKEGWEKTPSDERRRLEEELVSKPEWVIEGVSSVVRQAADSTIFLDIPRRVCYLRCAKRNWPYLFKSRPGLPDNCPEIKIVPTLAKIIWQFPRLVKPVILKDLNEQAKIAVTLSNNLEITQFLREQEHQSREISDDLQKISRADA